MICKACGTPRCQKHCQICLRDASCHEDTGSGTTTVKWVACDGCNLWFAAPCAKLPADIVERLDVLPWKCDACAASQGDSVLIGADRGDIALPNTGSKAGLAAVPSAARIVDADVAADEAMGGDIGQGRRDVAHIRATDGSNSSFRTVVGMKRGRDSEPQEDESEQQVVSTDVLLGQGQEADVVVGRPYQPTKAEGGTPPEQKVGRTEGADTAAVTPTSNAADAGLAVAVREVTNPHRSRTTVVVPPRASAAGKAPAVTIMKSPMRSPSGSLSIKRPGGTPPTVKTPGTAPKAGSPTTQAFPSSPTQVPRPAPNPTQGRLSGSPTSQTSSGALQPSPSNLSATSMAASASGGATAAQVDKQREGVRNRFSKILQTHKPADMEPEMVKCIAATIEEAVFELPKTDRTETVKRLLFNINDKLNTGLRESIYTAELPANTLVRMSSAELANPVIKKEREEVVQKGQQDRNIKLIKETGALTTALFKCYRCGHRKCMFDQKQTRSADEPMTIFLTCLHCGWVMKRF